MLQLGYSFQQLFSPDLHAVPKCSDQYKFLKRLQKYNAQIKQEKCNGFKILQWQKIMTI